MGKEQEEFLQDVSKAANSGYNTDRFKKLKSFLGMKPSKQAQEDQEKVEEEERRKKLIEQARKDTYENS